MICDADLDSVQTSQQANCYHHHRRRRRERLTQRLSFKLNDNCPTHAQTQTYVTTDCTFSEPKSCSSIHQSTTTATEKWQQNYYYRHLSKRLKRLSKSRSSLSVTDLLTSYSTAVLIFCLSPAGRPYHVAHMSRINLIKKIITVKQSAKPNVQFYYKAYSGFAATIFNYCLVWIKSLHRRIGQT